MRRFSRAVIALLVSAATVPIAVAGTVLGSFLVLPLPATAPALKAGVESQISHVYDINGDEIGVFRKFEQSIPVQRPTISRRSQAGGGRGRGPQLLQPPRRRHPGHHARPGRRHPRPEPPAGRLDDHPAVREERGEGRQRRAHAHPQVPRGDPRQPARAQPRSTARRRSSSATSRRSIFGEGAYGVGAAAETYFRKPVSKLTLSESAMLVGIIPAPSVYQPRGNPDRRRCAAHRRARHDAPARRDHPGRPRRGGSAARVAHGRRQAAGPGDARVPAAAAADQVPVLRRLREEVPRGALRRRPGRRAAGCGSRPRSIPSCSWRPRSR